MTRARNPWGISQEELIRWAEKGMRASQESAQGQEAYQFRPEGGNWIDCSDVFYNEWKGKKRIVYLTPPTAAPSVAESVERFKAAMSDCSEQELEQARDVFCEALGLQRISAPGQEVAGKEASPDWYSCRGMEHSYEHPADVNLLEDVFANASQIQVGNEYDVDVCWTGTHRYRVVKVADDDSDDIEVELIHTDTKLYLAPPTSTAIAAMVIKQAAEHATNGEYAYEMGRGLYESEVDKSKPGWELFYELTNYERATWIVKAALQKISPANAEAELEALMIEATKRGMSYEEANHEAGTGNMHEAATAIVRRVLDEKGE